MLAVHEYVGPRRQVVSAGAEISDLVSLKKVVALCLSCRKKFNAAKARYVVKRHCPKGQGRCDGCRAYGIQQLLFHLDTVEHL